MRRHFPMSMDHGPPAMALRYDRNNIDGFYPFEPEFAGDYDFCDTELPARRGQQRFPLQNPRGFPLMANPRLPGRGPGLGLVRRPGFPLLAPMRMRLPHPVPHGMMREFQDARFRSSRGLLNFDHQLGPGPSLMVHQAGQPLFPSVRALLPGPYSFNGPTSLRPDFPDNSRSLLAHNAESSYGYYEFEAEGGDYGELENDEYTEYDEFNHPASQEDLEEYEADESGQDFYLDSVFDPNRAPLARTRMLNKPPLLSKRPPLLAQRPRRPADPESSAVLPKEEPKLGIDSPIDTTLFNTGWALAAREFYKTFQRFMYDYDPKFIWDDETDTQSQEKVFKSKTQERLYRQLKLLKDPHNPHESIMLGGNYWEWSDEQRWNILQKRMKQENASEETNFDETNGVKGKLFDETQLTPMFGKSVAALPAHDRLTLVLSEDLGFPDGCCVTDYCGICDINLRSLDAALRHYAGDAHLEEVHAWYARRLVTRRYLTPLEVRKEWVNCAIRAAMKKVKPIPDNWECSICDTTLFSYGEALGHTHTKAHKKLLNESEPSAMAKRRKTDGRTDYAPQYAQKRHKVMEYFCEACDLALPSQKAYDSHCLTLQHTRAATQHAILMMQKQGIALKEQQTELFCDACGMSLPSEKAYKSHCQTLQHTRAATQHAITEMQRLAQNGEQGRAESPPPPPPPRPPPTGAKAQHQESPTAQQTACAAGSRGCVNGSCTGCTLIQLKKLEEAKRQAVLMLSGYGREYGY